MGTKGKKAVPNALKGMLGRKEKGMATARKGHGVTPMKRYNKKK